MSLFYAALPSGVPLFLLENAVVKGRNEWKSLSVLWDFCGYPVHSLHITDEGTQARGRSGLAYKREHADFFPKKASL